MSPDRKKDDDGKSIKTGIAKIQLSSRPPEKMVGDIREEVVGTVEKDPRAESDEEESIVERKERARKEALERVMFRQAQEAAAAREVKERRMASDRAIERVRVSEPPKSFPPVVIRSSLPPAASQRASLSPLPKIFEAAVRGMESALADSKAVKDEAFRFLKYVIKILEGREKLEAKLNEIINKPEYVSAAITIAIQIEQLTKALRRLEDFLLNSLEVDGDGVAKLNPRNLNGLRNELSKAGDDIPRPPSHPPVKAEEADIGTAYLMPDTELVREFARVKNTPRDERTDDFDSFFDTLERHWEKLIKTTGVRVAGDTGYAHEFMAGLGRKMAQISQTLMQGGGLRKAPPKSENDEWGQGLRNLTGMVARGLQKIDNLYGPTSGEFLRQIDAGILEKELKTLGGELLAIEDQLRRQIRAPEGQQSVFGALRGKIEGVIGKPAPAFKTRSELEANRREIKQRMIGIRRLIQQKEELDNREDR